MAERMALLFDQDLSRRLVAAVEAVFPNSQHVLRAGLAEADDDVIWAFARDNELPIVPKDVDFHHRSVLRGFPPKVIWIRTGCGDRGRPDRAPGRDRRLSEGSANRVSDPPTGFLKIEPP